MISFEERVEDCWSTVNGECGVNDRQAIEILLAAQLECPLPYPWIIVETAYYSLNLDRAWFNLTGEEMLALPMFRVSHSRKAGEMVFNLISEPERPRIFCEPNYSLPMFTKTRMYPYLMQRCLTVRIKNPAVLPATEAALLRLREAARRALDTRWRGQPPRELPLPPKSLLYWCEVLQRLSPPLRDWETMVRSFVALAGRRAYLFDRPVDESDWAAVARAMTDSIPYWTRQMLLEFNRSVYWHKLEGVLPLKVLKMEWKRLKDAGILYADKGHLHLHSRDKLNEDVLALVNGQVEL